MFIGRKEELKILKERLFIKKASFIAMRGRRRIGKSRLIKEFSKEFPRKYFFTGLPPTRGITKKNQREEFVEQMKKQSLPIAGSEDWSDIFWVLGAYFEFLAAGLFHFFRYLQRP